MGGLSCYRPRPRSPGEHIPARRRARAPVQNTAAGMSAAHDALMTPRLIPALLAVGALCVLPGAASAAPRPESGRVSAAAFAGYDTPAVQRAEKRARKIAVARQNAVANTVDILFTTGCQAADPPACVPGDEGTAQTLLSAARSYEGMGWAAEQAAVYPQMARRLEGLRLRSRAYRPLAHALRAVGRYDAAYSAHPEACMDWTAFVVDFRDRACSRTRRRSRRARPSGHAPCAPQRGSRPRPPAAGRAHGQRAGLGSSSAVRSSWAPR